MSGTQVTGECRFSTRGNFTGEMIETERKPSTRQETDHSTGLTTKRATLRDERLKAQTVRKPLSGLKKGGVSLSRGNGLTY